MIQFDWSISLGNLISFTTFGGMLLWFLAGVKQKISSLEEDMKEIKEAIKTVSGQVIANLVSAGRMGAVEERVNLLINRVDRLADAARTT